MKISKLRIKNLRTITSEQVIDLSNGLTIVGPNNSGKSNTLLGIYYFFTGPENTHKYNHTIDLPFNQETIQTSLTCAFDFDLSKNLDREIVNAARKMQGMLLDHKQEGITNTFTINLVFRKSSPVYQIFPGVKQDIRKRTEYLSLQKFVIDSILDHFKCYRIPSEKSVEKIYKEFVTPLVKKEIAKAIQPYDAMIRESINSLSISMNQSLTEAGITEAEVTLDYPSGALENLISSLELQVDDANKSSIYSKGMGLQSTILFSALEWVTKQQQDNHVVWLIEEPETFMHPALAQKACMILEKLGDASTLVKTTHSLGFLPNNPSLISGVFFDRKEKSTSLKTYKTISHATSDIRSALGVRFSDYFNLSQINIFVEGETDVEYLRSAIKSYENKHSKKLVIGSNTNIISFGGCKNLSGFLRANYEFISKEVIAISLFDGDEAGDRATQDLRGFFGSKGGFYPDRDYTSIPGGKEIEGLFPDEWIWAAHRDHQNWFDPEGFDYDAAKNIKKVKIFDQHKKNFMNLMLDYMKNPYEESHPAPFDIVIEAVNEIAERGLKRLLNEP
ncbi:AAA family ATPase [Pseudomonas sp. CBMAI 2609]|uniref:AAA family ATPase n=1 Tax=Pseudomonas flavocrustae TaxID=2991719 RepID=A0ABT6IL22_9PSED|nr:AAA family ATPase [Pseudomonas sp. CBMAI 2609]MDH4765168.1 AAA family ATPase [Pseudomonas sp. CBMAI 2609]